ncbi:ABC transporter permease [Neobacillus piezotolerans]|uniref:Transport permease protein n=1 Tax=Neobacillus piezotolerans TaxID=2259171 RepID=A0A3D8GTJ2_9BACI|nr:ABC transporter permease [Neobacillus piezotolerans]RDU37551.1 ABC transporter permease [Neobacillus piezotolerans]
MVKDLKAILNYRHMLFSMVQRELRSRYKGSFFGFLWTFINPLLQLIVYSTVFPYLLRVKQENYPMFLFIALLPWIFFTTSVQNATSSIVGNANLVTKIHFPRMILPLSAVSTNLMNYIYSLVIVVPALLLTGVQLTVNLLWFPLILFIEFIFAFGLALIFSALHVKFRDIEHIVGVLVFCWFYVTPIVFPMDIFPPELARLMGINPMVGVIQSFRNIFLYGIQPDFGALAYSLIVALIALFIGFFVFKKYEKTFAEDL